MTYDDENWRAKRACLQMKIDDADLPELRTAVRELMEMVIELETTVYEKKPSPPLWIPVEPQELARAHADAARRLFGYWCPEHGAKREACCEGARRMEHLATSSMTFHERAVIEELTRQLKPGDGFPAQRASLIAFVARFATLLRKHGPFGMNRDEDILLKTFDAWVENEASYGPSTADSSKGYDHDLRR